MTRIGNSNKSTSAATISNSLSKNTHIHRICIKHWTVSSLFKFIKTCWESCQKSLPVQKAGIRCHGSIRLRRWWKVHHETIDDKIDQSFVGVSLKLLVTETLKYLISSDFSELKIQSPTLLSSRSKSNIEIICHQIGPIQTLFL